MHYFNKNESCINMMLMIVPLYWLYDNDNTEQSA